MIINNLLSRRRLRTRIGALRPQLYRSAYAWCHRPDQADDLVQEAMLKAIQHLHTLHDEESLRPWLFRIMANCHRDALRRQRNDVTLEPFDLAGEDSPAMHAERLSTVRSVRQAIHTLSDDHRKVLTLIDLQEFSYAEVAGILGIPIGTVMSRLSRARHQLRQQLLRDAAPAQPSLRVVREQP